MNRWFRGISKIEELRKRYRELLKQYHPDNGGNEETMKEINLEYDRVFADLSRFSSNSGPVVQAKNKKPKMKRLRALWSRLPILMQQLR